MELKFRQEDGPISAYCLLIAPYGIEIWKHRHNFQHKQLLIAPYGIEMGISSMVRNQHMTFNRTIWN